MLFFARGIYLDLLGIIPSHHRNMSFITRLDEKNSQTLPILLSTPFVSHLSTARDKLNVFEGSSGSKAGSERADHRSSIGALHGRGLVSAWTKVSQDLDILRIFFSRMGSRVVTWHKLLNFSA